MAKLLISLLAGLLAVAAVPEAVAAAASQRAVAPTTASERADMRRAVAAFQKARDRRCGQSGRATSPAPD